MARAGGGEPPVKVGFRAEHFLPMNGAAVDGGVLRLERPVDYYEKSGADAIAFLSLPSGPHLGAGRRPPFRAIPRRGKRCRALLQLSKINVFDAQSGRRM